MDLIQSIGIVGNGVVGHATARSYLEHMTVKVYDKVKEKSPNNLEDVLKCELVFVCLPSPQKTTGLGCNLEYIEDFFSLVTDQHKSGEDYKEVNYVLRSTVPIGTTRELRERFGLSKLVHSPEFLTARCAVLDAQMPSRNIVGVPSRRSGPETWEEWGAKLLLKLYKHRFPSTPCLLMSSDESEAVKLFLNSFFAVKVAYFNEVYQLAIKLDLDWESVLNGMLSDGRVSLSHTSVPGPDGKYGFGGTCLPKDLASLVSQIYQAGQRPYVTDAALERNGDCDRGWGG